MVSDQFLYFYFEYHAPILTLRLLVLDKEACSENSFKRASVLAGLCTKSVANENASVSTQAAYLIWIEIRVYFRACCICRKKWFFSENVSKSEKAERTSCSTVQLLSNAPTHICLSYRFVKRAILETLMSRQFFKIFEIFL